MTIVQTKPSNGSTVFVFATLRRHKYAFVLSSLLVIVLGGVVIYYLPNVYGAQSTLEISNKQLFLAQSGSDAAQVDKIARRFYATRDSILSNDSVKEMLLKFGLVDASVQGDKLDHAIAKFRKSASIELVQSDVINPYSGLQGKLSTGIAIAYENPSPQLAYGITKELTDKFLQISEHKRNSTDSKVLQYLKAQIKSAQSQIRAADSALADYKHHNAMYLPELQAATLNQYNELQLHLSQLQNSVRALQGRENEVRSQLATVSKDAYLYNVDGSRIVGPEEKLVLLKAQLADESAQYSSDHPDIIRLKKEISSLQNYQSNGDTSALEIELAKVKQQLAEESKKYTPEYPDIRRLESRKQELEKQLAEANKRGVPKPPSAPTNPAYLNLFTRLEGIQDAYNKAVADQATTKAQLKAVSQELPKFPLVEKRISELQRRSDELSKKYDRLVAEYQDAELKSSMNSADLSARFLLSEAPVLPTEPSKPHKLVLGAVLLILALSVGAAAALVRDELDDRIGGEALLAQVVTEPVYLVPKFR